MISLDCVPDNIQTYAGQFHVSLQCYNSRPRQRHAFLERKRDSDSVCVYMKVVQDLRNFKCILRDLIRHPCLAVKIAHATPMPTLER